MMCQRPDTNERGALVDRLLLLWIAGTAVFYFLRFSATFYYANAPAIRSFASKLGF
ncbi:MAG: hypothetical protein JNK74_02805 [Candidatus Hydrogenedentes bacterium]|nr:hypothetical protein [Candidatus Hydrogenedentota bacterium]